jgi:hypothetical protein
MKNLKQVLLMSTCLLMGSISQRALGSEDPSWGARAPTRARAPIASPDHILADIKAAEDQVISQFAAKPEIREATRVVVLGVTGAGKSTLLHGLANKRLLVNEDAGGTASIEVARGEMLPGFDVRGGAASVTTIPGGWYDAENRLVFWDCPGFGDSRGANQDIINAFAIDVILQSPAKIKVLLVAQQSEIVDSRMINLMNRFEKLSKTFQNIRDLEDSVSLVVTKKTARFKAIPAIEKAIREIEAGGQKPHSLASFFARNPDRIFSLPIPPDSAAMGDHYNPYFTDRNLIIGHLQTRPAVNPSHSIDLDPTCEVYIMGMLKKLDDPGQLLTDLGRDMQSEYRIQELDALKGWQGFVGRLSALSDEDMNIPKRLVSLIEETIPSGLVKFKGTLDRILGTNRIFIFLDKVYRGLGGVVRQKPISETLKPMLRDMESELTQLVTSKQLIAEQKQATEKLQGDLEQQKIAAEEAEAENKRKMQEFEERSKEESAKLQERLNEEVEAGKLARAEADKQLKEHEVAAKQARKEAKIKMKELEDSMRSKQAETEKVLAETRNTLHTKELETERKISELRMQQDNALSRLKTEREEDRKAYESKVQEMQNKLEEAARPKTPPTVEKEPTIIYVERPQPQPQPQYLPYPPFMFPIFDHYY